MARLYMSFKFNKEKQQSRTRFLIKQNTSLIISCKAQKDISETQIQR